MKGRIQQGRNQRKGGSVDLYMNESGQDKGMSPWMKGWKDESIKLWITERRHEWMNEWIKQ